VPRLSIIMLRTSIKAGTQAGILYLVVIVTGMFSLAYVPQKLIDGENAAVTFVNITTRHFLFRLGIYSSVICYIAFVFLLFALYRFLKKVEPSYAAAMVVLALLSVTISFNNLQYSYTILTLTRNDVFLNHMPMDQLRSMVLLSLHQYNKGILIASIFWGLWLFPFGLLVYKSGFIPGVLGILLMLGCAGYLINFTGNTLFEHYAATGFGRFMSLLPAIAEISICCWLLFFGIKNNLQWKAKNYPTRILKSI